MTITKTLIILAGIIGVALVSLGKDPGSAAGTIAIAGVLLLVANNVNSGFANVLIAREKGKVPPLVLSSSSMMLGGAGLIIFSIPIEGWHWMPKPPLFYISLAWLSILSAVAISLWTVLLKRPEIKVSDLNLWKFLIPVSGATLSWILLSEEQPQLLSVIGMIIIAACLVILNLVSRNAGSTHLKEIDLVKLK